MMTLLTTVATTQFAADALRGGTAALVQPMALFSGQFLTYAIIFFVLALVAALVGFRGVAGISMEIARIFILIFLVLAVITLVL